MRRAPRLGLVAILLVLPLTAPAQVTRCPPGPAPSPDAAARDAERVAEEALARARAERLLPAPGVSGVPPVRHPALDADAVGEVQSRALRRLLRR